MSRLFGADTVKNMRQYFMQRFICLGISQAYPHVKTVRVKIKAHKKAPGLSTWGFFIVSGAPASFELEGESPVFIGCF